MSTNNLSVTCPRCGATPEQQCVSISGRRARIHEDRRRARGTKWRTVEQVYVVLNDDADNDMTTGDLVTGLPYWLDEQTKVTVKVNLSNPSASVPVNQYRDNLHAIGWADDTRAQQLNIPALVEAGRAAVAKRRAAEAERIRKARAAARAAKKAAREAAQV